MFVSTPNNQVIAIDAKSGNVLWRYRRPRPAGSNVPHDTSRGVALLGDRVYFAAGEAVLVALDAKTGREVWTTTVADNKSGYYISLAPLIAGGKVMVGASGGEYGIRGFIAAFDPETGKEQWRTYTIPAPGEPGSETWPKGDQWKNGGGPIWVTGNYDPDTNLAYWGVGNGGPWMGDQRPGDNLYTSSTIALDVATGAIKGALPISSERFLGLGRSFPADPGRLPAQRPHHQGSDRFRARRLCVVYRSQRGRPRRPHEVHRRQAFRARRTCFKSLDPETGRPNVDPAHKPGTGKARGFLPRTARRQELASHRVQPQDPDGLRSGQQQHLRRLHRNHGDLCSGPRLHRRSDGQRAVLPRAPTISAKCRPGMSTPASACGRTTTRSPRTGAACSPRPADWSSAAAPTIARFTPSTRPAESFCGSFRPAREFSPRRPLSCSTASSTSPCYPGGAAIRAGCKNQLNGLFPGQFPEVPEGGSVWVFAVE